MSDEELIKYLWMLLVKVYDGDVPSDSNLEAAWGELVKRGFESGEVFEGYY